jgi:hypothetical protein
VITALAVLLVLFGLLVPDHLGELGPGALIRIPIEALILTGLALVLPDRFMRWIAMVAGALLGVVTVVKLLDIGFYAAFDRPFDPLIDYTFFPPAIEVLARSIGRPAAIAAAALAAVLAVGLIVLMPLAVRRLTRRVARHPTVTARAAVALGAVWVVCAAFGLQAVAGLPIADRNATGVAAAQLNQIRADLADRKVFAHEQAVDRFAGVPRDALLTGLRGKNVLLVFVESYGRVAIQGSDFAPEVNALLDNGSSRLRAAGFGARSAFLTSPTYGGASWLAHSTLQSGLWIDSQQRYLSVISGQRQTLTSAFRAAGWRTVGVVPANDFDWPEASFYGYDQIYDSRNIGYHGPGFNLDSMPDQYTLSAFQRDELSVPGHPPVMAEIDLLSSHAPWAPLPTLIPWNSVGDGSVFTGMPERGQSADQVWRDPKRIRAEYGHSIEYSLDTLISYVQTYGDDNTVMIVLGDHQPAPVVTGEGASRDVPISIIAKDPAVLAQIAGWGWSDGLRPDGTAPVWRMDSFRDRFLTAFGSRQ